MENKTFRKLLDNIDLFHSTVMKSDLESLATNIDQANSEGQMQARVKPNGGYNMNSEAIVKLTVKGETILREHFKNYPSLVKVDANKLYKTNLWEMMHIFGEHLYNGCEIPFEGNIITIAVSV